MKPDPRFAAALRRELSDWRVWLARALVIAAAAGAGLTIVAFTWLTERALRSFFSLQAAWAWAPLIWTPLCAAAIVWLTRRYAPGTAGSGIPQTMAALDPRVGPVDRLRGFVSIRLALAKIALTSWGLLAGLSIGREGPSVQIGASVMHLARRWLPQGAAISDHGLIVAGGAAGMAATFNTPLAGVMFAIEQLSRTPEQRNNGLLITGIVLAGLVAVSFHGNSTYFGVIRVPEVGLSLLGPGALVAVCSGVLGGLFARLLLASLSGRSPGRVTGWRRAHPIRFAFACGLAVAVIGVVTAGATFGGGYDHTRALLDGGESVPVVGLLLKFVATWLSAWSGVPGGVFAPALAIGASLGNDVAWLTSYPHPPALIALGMAGFLAAATHAPLTAFIVVMEMVDGHAMVLSLMACALVAHGLARLLSRPLYASLATLQVEQLAAAQRPDEAPGPEEREPIDKRGSN